MTICDFCSSPAAAWRYPCKDFELTLMFKHKDGSLMHMPWGSTDGWAACETCAALIEAGNWDTLAQHSVDTSPVIRLMQGVLAKGVAKKGILGLHREFQNNRLGERVKL